MAHAVSTTGNVMTLIALPLYVLAETGSAARTGITGAAAALPVIVGGVFGGTLVDRLGQRRASVLSDLASGAFLGLIPLLALTTGLPFWTLLVLVLLSGLLDAPGQVARETLLPELAEDAGVPLTRAAGLFDAVERGARLAGAPLAGVLVGLLGALPVLWLDTASFAVSAAVMAFGVPRALRAPTPTTGYWSSLGSGLRFVTRDPLLRAVVLLVLVTNMFDAARFGVLLPVYAERELNGGVALGLLVGASGLGAVLSAVAYGAVGHRLPARATFVTGFTVAGGSSTFALAAGLPLPWLLAASLMTGLGAGVVNPLITGVKLAQVPAGVRAGVFGLISAGAFAAAPLGVLLGGLTVEAFGVRPVLLVVGTLYVSATLTPLLGGPWRSMDRPRVPG